MINNGQVPDIRIPRVKPGDPVKAVDYNKMADALESLLMTIGGLVQAGKGSRLAFGELVEDDIPSVEILSRVAKYHAA